MNSEELEKLRKEYKMAALDFKQLSKEPLSLFNKWFKDASSAEEMEPNAMALATVGKDMSPSVRMVLLKGIEREKFIFYTNYNSQKGIELMNNKNASLLFWWQSIERQVRIKGIVDKVSAQESDDYFKSRPVGSQLGAMSSPQSQVIESRDILEDNFNTLSSQYKDENEIKRPKHWGGFELNPTEFEFWQGRENRMHDRFRYRQVKGIGWVIERLAP